MKNPILIKLLKRVDLSKAEATQLFQSFFSYSLEQQAAILTALSSKRESFSELQGFHAGLLATQIRHPNAFDAIDIVGTGGDNVGSFNISTAASLIVAAGKVFVAKHGGRAVSSLAGSSDVLTKLNIPIPRTAFDVTNTLSRHHFAFISAPQFNPVFQQLASLRKNLGFPTIFNCLGPLLNPLQPTKQVIGVYRYDLIEKTILLLRELGVQHALVVHSEDGLDELSVSAATNIGELKLDSIRYYSITPEDVGLARAPLLAIKGGDASENAKIITDLLCNQLIGPKLDIALFNAAAGFYVAGKVASLKEGVAFARQLIESGACADFLKKIQLGDQNA